MARRFDRSSHSPSSEAVGASIRGGRAKSNRWLFSGIGLALLLGGFGVAWQRGWIFPPPISIPENLEQLEPDVHKLVVSHIQQVQAAPRDAAAHAELGLVYEANELWPEARRAFETAVQLDPDNAYWRLHLANTTFDSGDAEGSTRMLAELIQRAPDLAPAQQRYGEAMLAAGRLEDAEKALEAAVQLAPESPEALAGLADVRLRQGRAAEAIPLLQKAISYDRDYRVAHFLLGTAYQRTRQPEKAEQELRLGQQSKVRFILDEHSRRTEHYAVTVRARHARGLKLAAAGKFEQAAISLNAAHRASPKDVSIINALAGVYVQNKRTNEARQLLEKALSLDENHGTTYINLASWHLYAGNLDEALKYSEAAVAKAKAITTSHQVLIQTLIRMKKYDRAKAAADEAMALFPNDPAIQKLAAMVR